MNEKVKIIEVGTDGKEQEVSFAGLVSTLRQKEMLSGVNRVVVQVGEWRLLVILLGDTTEDLTTQLSSQ